MGRLFTRVAAVRFPPAQAVPYVRDGFAFGSLFFGLLRPISVAGLNRRRHRQPWLRLLYEGHKKIRHSFCGKRPCRSMFRFVLLIVHGTEDKLMDTNRNQAAVNPSEENNPSDAEAADQAL